MPLLTLEEIEEAAPVFRGKCGNRLVRTAMKAFAIDKINDLYDRNCSFTGPEFAKAILEDIGVRYTVYNREVLDTLGSGPFITVSNHPYGSIDGIILADLFGHLRGDYKIIVNKVLSRIEALGVNFINVTPSGKDRTAPTRDSISGIKEAVRHVRDGHPLGIFPSGAVSDLSIRDRCVRDREWQMPIIQLIRKLNGPVLPVRFLDRNLLRLPSEVFNKKGKPVRLVCGNIIAPQEQEQFQDMARFRDFLRERVYSLQKPR